MTNEPKEEKINPITQRELDYLRAGRPPRVVDESHLISEEDLRKHNPTAMLVEPAYFENLYSYSIDVEVTDKVLEVFNKEWDDATYERDLPNRTRRALQKVVDHWNEPAKKDESEVDIVAWREGNKVVVGSGKLIVTDKGLEMVGTIDETYNKKINEGVVTGMSIYQPPFNDPKTIYADTRNKMSMDWGLPNA